MDDKEIARMRGYSVEEAMAQSVEEAMLPAYFEIAMEIVTEELEMHNKGQRPKDRSRTIELELFCKDGSTVWVEATMNFIRNDNGKAVGILGITRDITERKNAEAEKKQLETQLRQAQKMESIGTLTGGIAHDFNNILGIILGNTELALEDVPEWNPAHFCLEDIKAASVRAADIVNSFSASAVR